MKVSETVATPESSHKIEIIQNDIKRLMNSVDNIQNEFDKKLQHHYDGILNK